MVVDVHGKPNLARKKNRISASVKEKHYRHEQKAKGPKIQKEEKPTRSYIYTSVRRLIVHYQIDASFSLPFTFNVPGRDHRAKDVLGRNVYERSRPVGKLLR